MSDETFQFNCSLRDTRIMGELYQPFSKIVLDVLKECWSKNIPVHLTQGFRYFGEQDVLFQAGKSNAQGGASYHNYGLAVDFCFDNSPLIGVQDPYKEPFDGAYKAVADIAVSHGLTAGFYWTSFNDKPHLQAKITSKIEDLRSVLLKNGIKAVYDLLDTNKEIICPT